MGDETIERTITSEADHQRTLEARAEILVAYTAHRPVCRSLEPKRDEIVRVGRKSVCDLRFEDPELSGDHCGIVHLGGNAWRITDYGTKNGTLVNGLRVTNRSFEVERERVVVQAGATILVLGSFDGFLRGPVDTGAYVKGHALTKAHNDIANAAYAGLPLLIRGESGTGKEEAVKHAHRSSRNKRGPLVVVNSGSVASEDLAEATLFGVHRGAASGVAAREGLFAQAHGGMIVFDEVHQLAGWLQPKLLRVVQEGTFRPVGGPERKADFQIVSVTNVDLHARVAEGRFAHDLYMRLAGKTVPLPPLWARPDEVAYLVEHFADGHPVHADYVAECLLRPWPGHVRELEMATKAALAQARASDAPKIRASHLSPSAGVAASTAPPAKSKTVKEPNDPRWVKLRDEYLEHRNQKRAAEAAGVPVATANRWLRDARLVDD